MTTPDATSGETSPKHDLYRVRGETVSVGAAVEVILGVLARSFAGSKQRAPSRRWNDLKHYVRRVPELSRILDADIGKVGSYFTAREKAAHSPIVVSGVAGGDGRSVQLWRFVETNGSIRPEIVTIADLKEECQAAREGYQALQVIGRALDSHDPTVLRTLPLLGRLFVLGSM